MEKIELSLPKALIDKIDKLSRKKGFSSKEEFILYILRKYIEDSVTMDNDISEEERKKIVEKLKGLGYLE